MNNERIDLKQFEGITEGPWHFAGVFGGMMLVTAYPHDMIVRQNDGEGDCRLRLGEINSPYDGKAIAQLPDLIAELKKCYEEIDLVHRNLSIVRNALARGYPDIEEEIWKLIDASE